MFYGVSDQRYLSVEDAARILRVSEWTLYRNLDDVPHVRVGTLIKIPCEWLFLEPPKVPVIRGSVTPPRWFEQPPLPFEVKPERRWRNSKRLVRLNHFGEPLDALANFS